jgi:hypothetical protein
MKFINGKIKSLLAICVTLIFCGEIRGQITVQIGTGNDAPAATQYSPVFRFSATSVTTNSRSDILFTQAELATAGVPAGATIIAVQFNKLTAHNFVTSSNFNMLMSNSSNTALDPSAITWAGITSTFTPVYSNTSFNVPATTGWVTWNLQTPFVYSGGALELATDNTMAGNGGATGNIAWQHTASVPMSMIIGSTQLNTFGSGLSAYRLRPNIKITYYPPQTTVQIGIGNDAFTTQYSPIYRFSAASTATNSRSDILFSQTELTTAGIPPGATITAVQFNKLTAHNFVTPSNFNMLMSNSSNTALDPSVMTWAGITSTFTPVYSNSSFNVPATTGWVTWNLQTPIIYSGGGLEIATDNTMIGNGGATGNFSWQYTASTPLSMIVGCTNLNTFASGLSAYRLRPNIKITYYPPACPAPSLPPVVTNITGNAATISWNTVSGAIGYQYAITTSATPPASGTDIVSNNLNATGLNPLTQYYVHVRTNCGSGYSLFWSTNAFNTLEPCPRPANIGVIINTNRTAIINWIPSPYGAINYEYELSTSATPPASGTPITDTFFNASNLSSATQYYIHLRTNCGGGLFSPWAVRSFTTGCFTPVVNVNLANNKAVTAWPKVANTIKYEYSLSYTPAKPLSGSYTIDTFYVMDKLHEGSSYYFHIRSVCIDGSVSEWSLTDFRIQGLQVYPNPVKEMLSIRLNGISSNGRISIVDGTGRAVRQMSVAGTPINIDTRTWASGMYLVLYDDGQNRYTVKIVKE